MRLSFPLRRPTKPLAVYHLANGPLIPLLFGKWEIAKNLLTKGVATDEFIHGMRSPVERSRALSVFGPDISL